MKLRSPQICKRLLTHTCSNFWVVFVIFIGCGIEVGNPDDDPTDENLAVVGLEVTPDSSSDVESLNLAFANIEFVKEDGTSTTIPTSNPDQYIELAGTTTNSLSLTEADSEITSTEILNEGKLPPGDYTSVILYVNKTKKGKARFQGNDLPLEIGEDSYEAIEVSVELLVEKGASNRVVLSPNLVDSLSASASGNRFLFKPSFRTSKRKSSAFVLGNISGQSKGLLCAYPTKGFEANQAPKKISDAILKKKRAVRAEKPILEQRPADVNQLKICAKTPFRSKLRLNGRFRFHHGLPQGDYKFILRNADGELFESSANISVIPGEINQFPDISMQPLNP